MLMFGIILIWILIGMCVEYNEEKKRCQARRRARKRNRRVYDYCIEEDYYSKKSA